MTREEAIDVAIEALKGADGDLIRRQDAIRWVKTECNPYGKPTLDFESGKKVIEHLEQIPSVEPKTGEWTKVIDEETPNVVKWHYECDQCGAGRWENDQRYCHNCGARMIPRVRIRKPGWEGMR